MREAIRRSLRTAPPLYPALKERLANPEAAVQVAVEVVDDASMHRLNLDFRGKDKPTDVLSFPLWEGEVFPLEEEAAALGDLIISVETAARQARELNHDLLHEMAFLAVHGCLHLLGYDHRTSAQRRRMWQLQESIFAMVMPEASHQGS